MPERSLAMLYAPRGIGKTLLGLSIGLAIASGTPLLRWSAPDGCTVRGRAHGSRSGVDGPWAQRASREGDARRRSRSRRATRSSSSLTASVGGNCASMRLRRLLRLNAVTVASPGPVATLPPRRSSNVTPTTRRSDTLMGRLYGPEVNSFIADRPSGGIHINYWHTLADLANFGPAG
jgi:hypothetical protein